ncbi:hypothetical protein B0H16DRAFT_971374 [Mycena metata]|uniref:Uncharacterized protein n=1 Tax=Mycena metata TaxID=1033252 RepID=A0AAD7INC1_9AGAR|nr:hypothetical protein B0H16DRAFT_971374 [Mycena metata]
MEAPLEMSLAYKRPQTAQAVTSLPAQSSNLFQNAAGFHIVGGQFVSGDVHNHQNTSPASTRVSSSPLDENFSQSEIYCNQLLRQKRGFPLYMPAPSETLPLVYRKKGVAIGDVGRVTPEGLFDFFFNIYLPGDHSINDNDVPENFVPLLPYGPKDIVKISYDPGDCVSTSSVQRLALDPPLDEFPGGNFVFSCGTPQGAILALPHGGHLEKLENLETIRAYAATHAESWYKYIREVRGRALANGALYLVTGCEKAQSWGMASFHSVSDEFQLAFKPRIRPDSASQYRWSGVHGHRLPAQHKSYNPSADRNPLNQTTFIHGLSISLGVGLWAKLFAKVEIRDIGDSHLGGVNGNSMSYSAGSSLFSWSLGILGGGAPTGGKQHTERRENVFLSDLSPISKIFHPGEIINAYILHKPPSYCLMTMIGPIFCQTSRAQVSQYKRFQNWCNK